ncbi:hypothetical protein [Pelagibacterium mangrovi]|uniref:hypothetical protein n=1 Tax=Pelagibacterium mangrovi TaxID=3119828 RepID=UPI002FCBEBEE
MAKHLSLVSSSPYIEGSQGGEPPRGDDLEARVTLLEKQFEKLDGKVDLLSRDVAEIKGEIKRLPGYPGLFVICAALVGVVGLLIRFL